MFIQQALCKQLYYSLVTLQACFERTSQTPQAPIQRYVLSKCTKGSGTRRRCSFHPACFRVCSIWAI